MVSFRQLPLLRRKVSKKEVHRVLFKNILRLEWKPSLKKFAALVKDHPLLRQLTKEAGLGEVIYVKPKDIDKLLDAASKHNISIETIGYEG